MGGVLASLQKKGLIGLYGDGKEATVDFTPEGIAKVIALRGGANEARRHPTPTVPGAGSGLEWHRHKDGFVGLVNGARHFLLDPSPDDDWILWSVNPKTGFQTGKIGRYPTAADAKDAARWSASEVHRVSEREPSFKRPGARVKYNYTGGPIPPGTMGTIIGFLSKSYQAQVRWDNETISNHTPDEYDVIPRGTKRASW
jgi:hypothetical protein